MNCELTWNIVQNSTSILFIEDPLHGGTIDKMVYHSMYNKLLDQLNGDTMSDYFDFYFHKSPLNENCWIFQDEDSKEDFLDWCQDLNILPSLKEIHAGETFNQKTDRIDKEKKDREERLRRNVFIQQQQKKLGEKKNKSKLHAAFNKREQMLLTISNIKKELQKDNLSNDIKLKLSLKLDKTLKLLDKTM